MPSAESLIDPNAMETLQRDIKAELGPEMMECMAAVEQQMPELPVVLELWVDAHGGKNDIKRQKAYQRMRAFYDSEPREVISELAWVLSKTKQRARRQAIEDLLDRLTRPQRDEAAY